MVWTETGSSRWKAAAFGNVARPRGDYSPRVVLRGSLRAYLPPLMCANTRRSVASG